MFHIEQEQGGTIANRSLNCSKSNISISRARTADLSVKGKLKVRAESPNLMFTNSKII
jgi:hypothetical protein